MKVFCLGGAGKICREAILDLVQYSKFEKITVADFNEQEGQVVVKWLNDPRVDFMQVDVTNVEETVAKMNGYDIVLDGTTIKLNGLSSECIAKAGCHGINLNGFGEEAKWNDLFGKNGKTLLPGFGMTPGLTQMMAMHAACQMDAVESVRVSHGSFRPIAFSASIAETTAYEYDPNLLTRVVYEDGEMKQVPPFARPRNIQLPEPYGETLQYIIPHAETITLSKALKEKGIKLIETRGTWPEKNMNLVKSLFDYGILRNTPITVNGKEVGIMDCISQYLLQSEEGQMTELYGYALHVEVEGTKQGGQIRHTLYHTHPASDGSVPGWEKLRAYTRNVAIPFAIAASLIAEGHVEKKGVITPEEAFSDPSIIFEELKRRGIFVHEEIEAIEGEAVLPHI
ncbi:saccharopine dehydrogenase family protein [Pseudobacillus wudalianchiensis]|uniref:Saccharopine dehydrogenase n=1 Tax=Pseudobacillus wudalianchiensis TaxID=1743143 RepID=A0A1B9B852_9BACI|nr:saccharopine dehydrogenase C-terminal domain-containing protein [Bacillus wudalianchiensis]OCA92261.1 saccharopine dehydrogenase [Bacillus wudalianchiensis]